MYCAWVYSSFLVHVLVSHVRSSGTLDDVAFEKIFPTKAVTSPNIMVSHVVAFCGSLPTRMPLEAVCVDLPL